MVYDTFAKEMVLEPTGIVKAKKPERKDTYEGMKRVELHLHTNMSAMDGMSSTASLLCRAAKWGHRAMAITDHGVAQAFPEALHAQEGKQKDTIGDMKIIYGIEASASMTRTAFRSCAAGAPSRSTARSSCSTLRPPDSIR